MHDKGAELGLELLAHGARCGRATNDDALDTKVIARREPVGVDMLKQHHPDGRNAEGQRHLLVAHQLVDALAVERRSGHHQLGATHGTGIGHAPGIDVEHRDDHQRRILRAQSEYISRADGEGMQHR